MDMDNIWLKPGWLLAVDKLIGAFGMRMPMLVKQLQPVVGNTGHKLIGNLQDRLLEHMVAGRHKTLLIVDKSIIARKWLLAIRNWEFAIHNQFVIRKFQFADHKFLLAVHRFLLIIQLVEHKN